MTEVRKDFKDYEDYLRYLGDLMYGDVEEYDSSILDLFKIKGLNKDGSPKLWPMREEEFHERFLRQEL